MICNRMTKTLKIKLKFLRESFKDLLGEIDIQNNNCFDKLHRGIIDFNPCKRRTKESICNTAGSRKCDTGRRP